MGKEMMTGCLTDTNPLPLSCFHPARTETVATGNGTCQPAPACPFLFYYFGLLSSSRLENTSQDLQIFIFSFQLPCIVPSQTVPLMNQQRSPDLNSQAGHCFFWPGEHFLIVQHGLRRLRFVSIKETRKYICRSTEAGMLRQACS
jgi:hypothetical protein